MNAPFSDGPPPAAAPSDARAAARAGWAAPEVAWPLSLAIGFGATFVGLLTGAPGLAAVLATAAFLPVWAGLLARARPTSAAACACAWMLGSAAAIVGAALESAPPTVAAALPFGTDCARLQAELLRGHVVGTSASDVAFELLLFALALVLARARRGLLTLLGLALAVGALGAGAAAWAAEAVRDGLTPTLAALAGWPPPFVLALGGLAMAAAVVAEGRPLVAGHGLDARRRLLLATGALGGALALAASPWLLAAWRGWVAR